MNRRGFIRGAFSVLAAPAVVRAEVLMPISALHVPTDLEVATYGVVPKHWINAELAAVTRRAMIPRIVVQVHNTTPRLSIWRFDMDQPVNKLVDN